MSDSFQLLLLLCGLYLYECAQWTSLTTVGFRAILPWRWRRHEPWRSGPSWRKGALIGSPFPPLFPPLVCEPLPFGLGPSGLLLADEPRLVRWEEVKEVSVKDHDLLLGDRRLARLSTRRMTLLLARLIREVADLKPAARPRRLEKMLDARWDEAACRPRLRTFLRGAAPLLAMQSLLWVSVFAGLPLLLWTPLTVIWPQVAGGAALGWIACMIIFRLTLSRASWLEKEAWPDGSHRFMAMASPISTMRSADLLGRELMGDLEPLVVAAALLPREHFGELARRGLLSLDDRIVVAATGAAGGEDAAWLAAAERKRLVRVLERCDLSAGKLLAPPAPEDDRVVSFCPRCRSQYLHGEVCPGNGCEGRALISFARGRCS